MSRCRIKIDAIGTRVVPSSRKCHFFDLLRRIIRSEPVSSRVDSDEAEVALQKEGSCAGSQACACDGHRFFNFENSKLALVMQNKRCPTAHVGCPTAPFGRPAGVRTENSWSTFGRRLVHDTDIDQCTGCRVQLQYVVCFQVCGRYAQPFLDQNWSTTMSEGSWSMQGTRSVQPFARETRTTCSTTGSGLCLKNIPSCSRILL